VGHNVPFLFNNYVLDCQRYELRKGDAAVALEPQVFDLLVYLIENRDRVVSKDDLIASVWAGRIVSESTLTSRINAVRKAIGDSAEQQDFVRTIPRKGVRFVANVRARNQPLTAGRYLPLSRKFHSAARPTTSISRMRQSAAVPCL